MQKDIAIKHLQLRKTISKDLSTLVASLEYQVSSAFDLFMTTLKQHEDWTKVNAKT